jgi:hypothetical protein
VIFIGTVTRLPDTPRFCKQINEVLVGFRIERVLFGSAEPSTTQVAYAICHERLPSPPFSLGNRLIVFAYRNQRASPPDPLFRSPFPDFGVFAATPENISIISNAGSTLDSAQTDACWHEPYPSFPRQGASNGRVIEANNLFQGIGGATIELRSTRLSYAEAKEKAIRHAEVPSELIKKVVSDSAGKFDFGTLPQGEYEIRVVMVGRQPTTAYIGEDFPSQWRGRGVRVALSYEGKGCSRIYAAGLDDTDCGRWDCGGLPPGEMRVIHADGTPLSSKRLVFYRHSKKKPQSPELILNTRADGIVNTTMAHGCYDIPVERSRRIHLCFLPTLPSESVTVKLSPSS